MAAGDPPDSATFRARAEGYDYHIAADGGAEVYDRAGMVPHLIVGDVDSIQPAVLEKLRQMGSECLLVQKEKNETDTQLAVDEAIKRGGGDILVLGATGGRLDHTLVNLMLLKYAWEQGAKLSIEGMHEIIEIGYGEFTVNGNIGQTVSILPVNESAVVNVQGLYYPLQNLLLKNNNSRGVSNVFCEPCAHIQTNAPVWVIRLKK